MLNRKLEAFEDPPGNDDTGSKVSLFVLNQTFNHMLLSDGDSDQEPDDDEELSKLYSKGLTSSAANYSYLGLTDSSHSLPGGASYDMSPLSSPEKELGGKQRERGVYHPQ